MVSSCRRRASSDDELVTSGGSIYSGVLSRYRSLAVSQDSADFEYALGTLEYRKQRTRKRTKTGEYVWSDEADIVFAMALIGWTSNRLNRLGTRRANYLQKFLADNGFVKTRKQIASRLQVLKGEWRATSYMRLLDDPDHPTSSSSRRHVSPPSPSDDGDLCYPSPPPSFTPSPTSYDAPNSSTRSAFDYTTYGDDHQFSPPPIVQDHTFQTKPFVQDDYRFANDHRHQLLERPESMPFQIPDHRLQMHAPTAQVPGPPQKSSASLPMSYPVPTLAIPQALLSNTFIPSVPNYGGSSLDTSMGGSFRQPHPFSY